MRRTIFWKLVVNNCVIAWLFVTKNDRLFGMELCFVSQDGTPHCQLLIERLSLLLKTFIEPPQDWWGWGTPLTIDSEAGEGE